MPAKRFLAAALLAAPLLSPTDVQAKDKPLHIVTTTEDLASLASEVGGERVEGVSIARGYQDPHFVEPKPSFILHLRDADLLIAVGLQLETAWLPPLMNQSRNSKIIAGGQGYLDASQFATILEKPVGQVSRAMGDIHPLGNPHYWLDPDNGRRIAQAIQARLTKLRPADAAYFEQRYEDFDSRLAAAEKTWDQKLAPYRGTKVVTYHQSWPNFAARFGFLVEGYVEPKPGIPPSPGHTLELIAQMKSEGIKVIWVEPYFNIRTPKTIANAVGGEAIVLLPSTGGEKEASDYIKLFDYDVNLLATTLQKLGGSSN